jgi:hypothetical protein
VVSRLAIGQECVTQSVGHRHGCGLRGRVAFDTVGKQEALERSCPRGTPTAAPDQAAPGWKSGARLPRPSWPWILVVADEVVEVTARNLGDDAEPPGPPSRRSPGGSRRAPGSGRW